LNTAGGTENRGALITLPALVPGKEKRGGSSLLDRVRDERLRVVAARRRAPREEGKKEGREGGVQDADLRSALAGSRGGGGAASPTSTKRKGGEKPADLAVITAPQKGHATSRIAFLRAAARPWEEKEGEEEETRGRVPTAVAFQRTRREVREARRLVGRTGGREKKEREKVAPPPAYFRPNLRGTWRGDVGRL